MSEVRIQCLSCGEYLYADTMEDALKARRRHARKTHDAQGIAESMATLSLEEWT